MSASESRSTSRPQPTIVDTSVFSPLPIGARDLLPPEVRRRRALTSALLDRFERWGYREVSPTSLEYFEVLGRGLGPSDRERCVRFIEAGEAGTGALVALRSDVTPQIARMVAQRVGGSVAPNDSLRLCYAATLVRLPKGRHDRAELHQVGVEFVGDANATADAELIGLADEALLALGCSEHRFDLSHSRVVRDALTYLEVPLVVERELLDHLARKDLEGIEGVLAAAGVTGAPARTFASLAQLHGPPALLEANRSRLAEIGAGPAIDRLCEVVAVVGREHPNARERLLVDLGEARGFDYYTGMRMRVWAPGAGTPVVRGGRYDDLVARYGADLAATGFAFDLDALELALAAARAELEGTQLPAARLVATSDAPSDAPTEHAPGSLRSAAVLEAAESRAQGLRAWIEDEPTLEAACDQAERRGADRLTWLFVGARDGKAAVFVQRWRQQSQGWQQESEEIVDTP